MHIPQILLVGNGICQAFGGEDWNALLKKLAVDPSIDPNEIKMPEPLKAVLLTNDNVDQTMKKHKEELFGSVCSSEQGEFYREILSTGFDQILTTNYSYELEIARLGDKPITNYRLDHIRKHTDEVTKAESKYLLHTFNRVGGADVWHIHGEARNPDSMILGHYYYGNLLGKIKELLNKRKNSYEKEQQKGKSFELKSWVDGFILGDVYVLGFGFGWSELDLWWLLNRKKREKADHGKLHFYEMKSENNKHKYDMLRLLGAEVHNLDFACNLPDYKMFYREALIDIQNKLKENHTENTQAQSL